MKKNTCKMKKIFTILLVTILVACSKTDNNNKTGNLEISGRVEGLKKGKLYIHQLNDTNLVLLDSIIISGKSKTFLLYFIFRRNGRKEGGGDRTNPKTKKTTQ